METETYRNADHIEYLDEYGHALKYEYCSLETMQVLNYSTQGGCIEIWLNV